MAGKMGDITECSQEGCRPAKMLCTFQVQQVAAYETKGRRRGVHKQAGPRANFELGGGVHSVFLEAPQAVCSSCALLAGQLHSEEDT